MKNHLRMGIGYNIKYLKDNNPELYNKYRLLFAFFDIDDNPIIYHNELKQVSPKAAHEFFLEMHPHIKKMQDGEMTMEEAVDHVKNNVSFNLAE